MADISHEDLDALLTIENTVTTSSISPRAATDVASKGSAENIMISNREPFPSQMTFDYDNDVARFNTTSITTIDKIDSNLTLLPLMAQSNLNSDNSDSLILNVQEIETINLNDSTPCRSSQSIRNTLTAPCSLMRFSDKSERLDLPSNQGDKHDMVTFEDDYPKFSDIDFDEIENLELLRNSCANTLPTKDNMKYILPTIVTVKEEKLEYSSNQSEKEQTFARQLNAYDIELPNLDVDFELLDEVERAHTSRQAAVIMNATQKDAINLVTTDTGPRVPSTMSFSNRKGDLSSSANPIDFLSLQYENLTSQDDNEQQPNVDTSIIEQANDGILSQPLDYSRRDVAAEEAASTSRVIQEPNLNVINDSVVDATMIPLTVKQLYDVIRAEHSDFAFVYALSAQLCQNRVPMDCFVNLKMGLLLSIASIGQNPDIPPIPIIAIGNDAHMTNYLLENIGELAERFIGPTFDIKPPSNAGDKDHIWIEADPIVLAKGGVYYVGDWSILRPARVEKLYKIVECSRIPIEKTTYSYPLETAIWAHWRSFKNNAKEQQIFNKFVKVFGIPIVVNDDNHEVLVDFVLQQSSVRTFESTIDHLSISEADMRSFLSVISKRTVDHSAEAVLLLQKYFVASRIERPECLSKQAYVVLKQFAESFAKLSFRHEVLEIDAIAAIFMCENYVQNIFGASDNPPPKFETHNYVGNVHAHLKQFKKWLRKYIERYHDRP